MNTPETDAAVKKSNGQWSFVLKETCQRLERERDEAREALAISKKTIDRLVANLKIACETNYKYDLQ